MKEWKGPSAAKKKTAAPPPTKKKKAAVQPIKLAEAKPKDTAQKMQVLMAGLSEMYPLDYQAPGLVLSYLKTKKLWYASITRYEGRDGSKEVLVAGTAPTLDEAITALIVMWRNANRNGIHLAEMASREDSECRRADRRSPAGKRSYAIMPPDEDFDEPDFPDGHYNYNAN